VAEASGKLGESALFHLFGPGDSLIFLQTPQHVPPLDRLVAPGQSVSNRGTTARSQWIDLRYAHAGRQWAQRHDVFERGDMTFVMTAQCPADRLAEAVVTQQSLLGKLRLR
jgi:hypothetical protein